MTVDEHKFAVIRQLFPNFDKGEPVDGEEYDRAVSQNIFFAKDTLATDRKQKLAAYRATTKRLNAIDDEPLGEDYDKIMRHRFNISRELDL
jgi:hypothetical protein